MSDMDTGKAGIDSDGGKGCRVGVGKADENDGGNGQRAEGEVGGGADHGGVDCRQRVADGGKAGGGAVGEVGGVDCRCGALAVGFRHGSRGAGGSALRAKAAGRRPPVRTKYETLATVAIGLVLAWGALEIGWHALGGILRAVAGKGAGPGPSPWVFWTAVVSVVAKGWLYHATMATARATGSPALVANAWHHRSDAWSSVAVADGVGASVFFGEQWAVLDPVAALFVSVLLGRVAWQLLREQLGALTDRSLAPSLCEEILEMARGVEGVSDPHKLRTRMVGRYPVIDLHIRLPADMPLERAHRIATELERRYLARFGAETLVTLHLEPEKNRNAEERVGG